MSNAQTIDVAEVTKVTEALVEAVARLTGQLSREAPLPTMGQLRQLVDADATRLLVAEVEGRIVGCVTLAMYRVPTGVRAWIEDLVVDAAARGAGVGEALSRRAVALARASGAQRVDLTSRPSRKAANSLYQRLGFAQRETNVYRLRSD